MNQYYTLKPETEQEKKDAETINGKRQRIRTHQYHDMLTANIMDRARYEGLSGEDTYVMLAYAALLDRERLQAVISEYVLTTPRPVVMFTEKST